MPLSVDTTSRTSPDQQFSVDPLQFLHSVCNIFIHESRVVNEDMGGLIWLPSIAAAPDPEKFLDEALGGWSR
ncbi:hypothetical protein, partial [Paeniglutamicibacter sp. ZC-3]|uniref:hypothetical protein n=1 Tax=Paeniglutamicibacter sp. ZC-3 TaxID=2986919 RepID=UPI0021F7B070